MRKLLLFLGCIILAFAGACKKAPPPQPQIYVKTGGRELKATGVTFLVPWEAEAGHSDSPGGLTYESPTLRVILTHSVIYVNGNFYGPAKTGDVVNLLNSGKVYVNDKERAVQEPQHPFKESY